jgi:hypothetical protein
MILELVIAMSNVDGSPALAAAHSPLLDEIGIAVAIMLTMVGVALHLYRPRHQMSVEERVKDAKMTEDEARRQMRFYAWCAPAVTSVGIVLLTLAIYDLAG